MAPRVPRRHAVDRQIVGVAEPGGDAARAEIVVVPVPHRLGVETERDEEPREEGEREEDEREDRLAHAPLFRPATRALLSLSADSAGGGSDARMRRRYVFCTCAASSLRNLATSLTKPRT